MIDFKVKRLDEKSRPPFDCGDDDLNDFFNTDSIKNDAELLSVTYAVEYENELVVFFSISNDSIRKQKLPKDVIECIPKSKRYSSLPSVKIGRLATSKTRQSNGIGSAILNFIKGWFTEGNKTGCRFITVDAYNNKKTIDFYENNGFTLFDLKDEKVNEVKTRLMYFDLITFARGNEISNNFK